MMMEQCLLKLACIFTLGFRTIHLSFAAPFSTHITLLAFFSVPLSMGHDTRYQSLIMLEFPLKERHVTGMEYFK